MSKAITSEVVRFISTTSPEDNPFDADSDLKTGISDDMHDCFINMINQKISIGLLEKRYKFFKQNKEWLDFVDKSEGDML